MSSVNFKYKKVNTDKLINYGFEKQQDCFTYSTDIAKGEFALYVTVDGDAVSDKVIDKASGDEYVLYRTQSAVGSFVGMVRADVDSVLSDIADKCFEPDVFKSRQAKEIIAYVREKYGDELEFLWDKFAGNAVWRRKDNAKWYAVMLTVSAEKLKIPSNEKIEIIDMRIKPEEMEKTLDGKRYFPGYHMNKKHWYTIVLDCSVSTEEICRRIDESYALARNLK